MRTTGTTYQPTRNSYDAFLLEAEQLGVGVKEKSLGSGLCGFYLDPVKTIVIDDNLFDFQKRCVLCHELIHAKYGDSGEEHIQGKAESRTRKETALRLIDPESYKVAEAMYDGDPFLIATDLNVTVQVVQDYQYILDGVHRTKLKRLSLPI